MRIMIETKITDKILKKTVHYFESFSRTDKECIWW